MAAVGTLKLRKFNGEVAVKNHGWQRITSFEQLVNKLL